MPCAALVRPAAVENSMGGLPRRCRRGGRQRYPAGGLPGWSPAYPAFSLRSCPLSPHPPSPPGKGGGGIGGRKVNQRQGRQAANKASPPAGAGRARSAGDRPSCATPLGTCTAGTVSVANGLMQGCRGRSPRRNKLIVSPFPAGEGGRGGEGAESKLKAG